MPTQCLEEMIIFLKTTKVWGKMRNFAHSYYNKVEINVVYTTY